MLAVGLMSGTSLDGIDAALIDSDGADRVRAVAFHGLDYDDRTRSRLAEAARVALGMERPGPAPAIDDAARLLTDLHADVVHALLAKAGVAAGDVAVCGFHGQTVAHRPDRGWTWQIGDGQRLADAIGIDVVADFRSADVAAGGQGAPLLPVYHQALTAALPKPAAVLNLGGVGNLTWIGADGALIAFDTGPANGLIDDWMGLVSGARFDAGGTLAGQGQVALDVLDTMLDNPWFDAPPPKSLDRADFTIAPARGLSPADGAATLTRFTADTVALALGLVGRPQRLIVAGGGRHNPTLMRMIGDTCGLTPEPIETLGWNGDATEAEGFAYMALRTLDGRAISFPGTTGVAEAMTGGTLYRAAKDTARR
ncbi:anhydro-N-acetylmuramic acid kinase [uncultured Sphingomonas sp.]|uniref:anhydro-N-acetylmuramic acid kinase n=1 Tax=uncultured Sphingomonas sp. TaxID=158754 RepID=UPI00260085E7|nr:anhydro-N-acetylmuramic acid kinase [uncultured Sphingomonas sp.]